MTLRKVNFTFYIASYLTLTIKRAFTSFSFKGQWANSMGKNPWRTDMKLSGYMNKFTNSERTKNNLDIILLDSN